MCAPVSAMMTVATVLVTAAGMCASRQRVSVSPIPELQKEEIPSKLWPKVKLPNIGRF